MNKKERRDNGWRVAGIFFAVFSLVPLFLGFHKMFVYENGEYLWSEPVNAYVGGDAITI